MVIEINVLKTNSYLSRMRKQHMVLQLVGG